MKRTYTDEDVKIMRALLAAPQDARHTAATLYRATGVMAADVYVALDRMTQAAVLATDLEPPSAATKGRPLRRRYWLTDDGRRKVAAAIAIAEKQAKAAADAAAGGDA